MTRVRLTEDQLRDLGTEPSKAMSKWRNVRCEDELFQTGKRFDSRWERDVFYMLMADQRAGHIRNLATQVPFRLEVSNEHGVTFICKYIADFVYEERRGREWVHVVEDAKGHATREYAIKKRLMRACYGIDIRETFREK